MGSAKAVLLNSRKFRNALCHIVFILDKLSHVASYLEKLHWLPIPYHILSKYILVMFKAINISQPSYLSSLIKSHSLTHGNRLSVSSVYPIARRTFATDAPVEWSRLPIIVRSNRPCHTLEANSRLTCLD